MPTEPVCSSRWWQPVKSFCWFLCEQCAISIGEIQLPNCPFSLNTVSWFLCQLLHRKWFFVIVIFQSSIGRGFDFNVLSVNSTNTMREIPVTRYRINMVSLFAVGTGRVRDCLSVGVMSFSTRSNNFSKSLNINPHHSFKCARVFDRVLFRYCWKIHVNLSVWPIHVFFIVVFYDSENDNGSNCLSLSHHVIHFSRPERYVLRNFARSVRKMEKYNLRI